IKAVHMPSLLEAIVMVAIMIRLMSGSISYYETPPHIALLLAMLALITYGLIKKVCYKQDQSAMFEGDKAGSAAVLLFLMIGILIRSWMLACTIPTLIYGGF